MAFILCFIIIIIDIIIIIIIIMVDWAQSTNLLTNY